PEAAPHSVISWLELHHVGAVLARNHLRIRQQSAGCLPTASGSAAYEKPPNRISNRDFDTREQPPCRHYWGGGTRESAVAGAGGVRAGLVHDLCGLHDPHRCPA